ncbi:hypothetical protein CFOL_v3_35686, partial [Cephalotus follicularis]
ALLIVFTQTSFSAETDDVEPVSVPLDKILECMMSCIRVALVNDILDQENNLMHVFSVSLSPGFPWTVKLSAFSAIKELCSRVSNWLDDSQGTHLQGSIISIVKVLFHSVSPKVLECIITVKIAQVHVAASECLLEIMKLYRRISEVHLIDAGFEGELLHQYEVETNEAAKSLLRKCINIFQNLED